jgi:hypothetical protein
MDEYLASLELRMARTAAKSRRRKSALKQLQKAFDIERKVGELHAHRISDLSEENARLRRELQKTKSDHFNEFEKWWRSNPWWYRLFGGARV